MTLSDLLKTVPRIYFPTFLVLFVGGLFHLIAVTTSNWFVLGPVHAGLWTICGMPNSETMCVSIPSQGNYVAMRALSISALLIVGGSVTAAIALVVVNAKLKIAHVVAIGCLISFLASVITDILYWIQFASVSGLSISFTLGWSFVLSCLASGLFLIATILGITMASTIRSAINRQGTPGNSMVTHLADNMY